MVAVAAVGGLGETSPPSDKRAEKKAERQSARRPMLAAAESQGVPIEDSAGATSAAEPAAALTPVTSNKL